LHLTEGGCQTLLPRAALLLALALPACSDLALPKEDMVTAGAQPAFNTVVADQLKILFKDRAAYQGFEISGYRWVHGLKGWSWLACVRFQEHNHPRTYALFVKDGAVIDSRYAVETDACDGETYAPFDPATGLLQPANVGLQQPLY
jgi:hypothetical protein